VGVQTASSRLAGGGTTCRIMNLEKIRTFARALYPIGLMLAIMPFVDLALRAYPWRLGAIQWRFATIGLVFNNQTTALVGLFFIGIAALVIGHTTILRIVAALAGVAFAVELCAFGLFLLDSVQMHQTVPAQLKRALISSALSAVITGLFGLSSLLVLALTGWRASRGGHDAEPVRASRGKKQGMLFSADDERSRGAAASPVSTPSDIPATASSVPMPSTETA
jgi:hypothetical protein